MLRAQYRCASAQVHWWVAPRVLHVATVVSAALLGLTSAASAQSRPNHEGKMALFGTLHAHSELSGDVSTSKGLTPKECYDHARENGLDFLGISDHHKPTGAPGGSKYNLSASEYQQIVDAAEEANTSHAGSFVAFAGIEWGTIATGNHVNIFGAGSLPPNSIKDTEYEELHTWILNNAQFAQWNHPYSWGKKSNRNKNVGNFGRALYSSTSDFVSEVDAAAQLMSIICTVKGGHISGEHKDSTDKTHREVHSDALREYRKHLDMGFRLSPSANQDTHGKNPGSVTAARTGVWADSFTANGIAEAMKANRVFATEDDELAVAILVEYGGATYWMGETVPLLIDEAEVTLTIHVSQATGSDGDSTDEGPYWATVFSDSDGIGGAKAAEWETYLLDADTSDFTVTLPVVSGEYIYLEISEQGGSDNPVGDGEDEFMADGSEGADGHRDDLNDSAWTSPIWFSSGSVLTAYVWSRNSDLYHDPSCWVVPRIGLANRREGPAPNGRTRHSCHP